MSIEITKSEPTEREKFATKIECKCGQVGSATWEANAQLSAQEAKAILLDVSNGFYLRVRKKNISKIEIACSVCEASVRY